MNLNDAFPSKYLKAADLDGQQVKVRINRYEIEEMTDHKKKPVLYFGGQEKGLVLNKTNGTLIGANYGDEFDGWIGKEIVLFDTIVNDPQGRPVAAIRVRMPKPAGQQQRPAPKPQPEPEFHDDDVPY